MYSSAQDRNLLSLAERDVPARIGGDAFLRGFTPLSSASMETPRHNVWWAALPHPPSAISLLPHFDNFTLHILVYYNLVLMSGSLIYYNPAGVFLVRGHCNARTLGSP